MDEFDEILKAGNRKKSVLLRTSEKLEALNLPNSTPVPSADFYDGLAPPKPYVRAKGGRFAPGTRGGPGRGKSFAEMIRHISDDGAELVAFAFAILRGEVTSTVFGRDGQPMEVATSPALRVEVMKWLKDHGLGKAIDQVEISAKVEMTGGVDLSKLSLEELRTFHTLKRKAIADGETVDAE